MPYLAPDPEQPRLDDRHDVPPPGMKIRPVASPREPAPRALRVVEQPVIRPERAVENVKLPR